MCAVDAYIGISALHAIQDVAAFRSMVKVSTRAAFVLMYVVAATAAVGLESSFHAQGT